MKIFTKEIYQSDELALIKSEHRKAYLQLFKGTIFVQFFFSIVLSYTFHSIIPQHILLSWLLSILLITCCRAYLTFAWYKLDFNNHKTVLFEAVSLFLSFISGCLWGATVFAMNFNQYPELSVFLNIVVFGISAGTIGIGSYWLEYFLIYNITIFSIYVTAYIIGIPEHYYLLAMSLLIFVFFMLQIVLVFHHSNAQNISLRKRNENLAKNLSKKKQQAEDSAASRTRFLASASHDLRQPLQALNFFLSVLKPQLTSEKSLKTFSKLDQCADGMNELLSSILDLSKLDAETLLVKFEPCCLNTIFEHLQQQFQMQANDKNLKLVIHKAPYCVLSDTILLLRILSNLISNAIKYTSHGKVEILIKQNNKQLLVEVADTGPGLNASEQEKVFEEFYQLNNPERNKSKGLGLGLSIVKRLCLLMDIPISLKSEEGKGCVFSVSLPITEDVPVDKKEDENFLNLNSKKILIIDDEASIRESLSELLVQWGFKSQAVESETEALHMIERSHYIPDLIIADYRLRHYKTGVEAINKIKVKLNKSELAAIIISGDTEPARLKEVELSGYMLLHKPVKPMQLRMAIQQKLVSVIPLKINND